MIILRAFKRICGNAFQTAPLIVIPFVVCVAIGAVLTGMQQRLPHFLTSHFRDGIIKSRSIWDNEYGRQDEICRKILHSPEPYGRPCRDRNPENLSCAHGQADRYLMFSQYQQDYYLFVNHFSKLKRRGHYLDIATNDPIHISNSYFFDRCLKWDGICVEANPRYFEPIYTNRSCQLVPTCVSTEHGTQVTFVFDRGVGGIVGDTYKYSKRAEFESLREVNMTCTNVSRILSRFNVPVIDYLSLDVEGHELAVLQGIDWNRTIINVMTIEVTPVSVNRVSEFLQSKGYKQHSLNNGRKMLGVDIVYLHQDVVFGQPV